MTKLDKRGLSRQVYAALEMFGAVLTGEVPLTQENAVQLLGELQEQRQAFNEIVDDWIK